MLITDIPNITNTHPIPPEFVALDSDLRFIKVKPRSKQPAEIEWQSGNNYSANDPRLIQWIQSGNNWGYFLRDDTSLCVLDADSPNALEDLIRFIGSSLTVQSGRDGKGYHILFRCPNLGTQKIFLKDGTGKKDIGDIRPGGTGRKYQTVGPGSFHPDTGRPYLIVDNSTPAIIDPDALREVLKKYQKPIQKKHGRRNVQTGEIDNYLTQQAGILFNQGFRDNGLFNALVTINREDCTPPAQDSDLRRICSSAMRNFKPAAPVSAGFQKPVSSNAFTLTDLGNAERFKLLYEDMVKYCPTLKAWFIWDGKVWARDDTNERELLAIETVRRIYGEAENEPDEKRRIKLAAWATASESHNKRSAMLQTVSSMLSIHNNMLDAKPDLFNLQNGTYNLVNHTFKEHCQSDLLTKIGGVEYQPRAICPTWEKHLNLIFSHDEDLIHGFQELCGYALLSGNPAEIFVVAWGSGRNGKGKTFDAITHIFGDYSGNTPFSTFVVSKFAGRGSASPEIVDLVATRFVRASESEEGARLAESLIKSLTGGDLITARGLYQGNITFKPEFTIFLQTNHKPVVRNWDQAIEARLWLIPFDKYIEQEYRDYQILEKLQAEGSGIFNWMIEGLKRFQTRGRLIQPKRVKQATEEYKQEQDRLSEFVASLCVKGKDESCYRKDLFTAYHNDCAQNGIEPVTQNMFSRLLQSHHGIREGQRREGGRTWIGIRLKSNSDTPDTFLQKFPNNDSANQGCKKLSDMSDGHETVLIPLEKPCNALGSSVTSVTSDTFLQKSVHEVNTSSTYEKKCQTCHSVRNWLDLHEAHGLPDPSRYRLVDKPGAAQCRCKGCTAMPLMDVGGLYPLCQKHFAEYRDLWEKDTAVVQ